jgi:D-aminopeptidase
MRNIEHDQLPPDVRRIRGHNKPFGMLQGAEPGIAGIIYIGYHAPQRRSPASWITPISAPKSIK